MSELKVNKVSPSSGTGVQLGDSGDTITIPAGATITNSGTATNFGDSFGLSNNEIAIKNNSGNLDGLAIGTAGQVLTVNSGANGFEFADAAGGGTISAYGFSYNHTTQGLINGFSANIAFQGSSNSGNYLSDSTVIKMGASYNTSTPYNSMWLQATGRYLVTHYIYAGFAGTSNGGTGASVQWEPYYIRNNQMNFVQFARNAQIYQEKMVISNTNYTYRVGQTMTYLHTATTNQEYIVLKGNGAWASGNFNVYAFNTFIAKYD